MSGFFGIIMSSLQPAISSKSLTARANASTASVNVSSTANNRGTLSYSWKRSGKNSTIAFPGASTTYVQGLDTNEGSSTIYCDITDSVTGVTVSSPEAVITWTAVTTQNIVISRAVTYTGSAQAYTLTGTPATPAPSGTPSTFINAGTYVYSTNITSITPGSDYALGTVTGSFTIGKAILTITTNNASMTYGSSLPTFTHTSTGFVNSETSTVITGTVTHSTTGSSTSNAGTYSITPSVSGLTATNYTFTPVNGTLTINRATLTITSSNTSMTYGSSLPTFTYTSTGFLGSDNASVINGTVTHTTTGSSTANAGSYTITPVVSGLSATNYTFSPSNGTLTINKATISGTLANASFTYDGSSKSATVITNILPTGATYTGNPSVSATAAGTYTSSIIGSNNYQGTVTGTLTINRATLTASTRTGSATFNGISQSITVLSGINGTFDGLTSVSGINAGSYITTINGTVNYTGSVVGTLTISPATITLQGSGESKTYNGTTQSVGYTVGGSAMNNYSYIISGTSAINAGTYTATITSTTSNYVISSTINSFNWTIHPAPASSSPASGTTIYQVYDGSTKSATVISGLSGLSIVSGSAHTSGVNAGTYPTTITLGGNYSGSITGYLVISQAFGDISVYFGGYVPAGDTNTKVFDDYLQRANARYTWSASVSGPGARDAYIQEGFGVQSLSYATSGFVVTITATISDPNYGASSATTSITFEAYVPPRDGGGGFIAE
jgi:hypothetical protein